MSRIYNKRGERMRGEKPILLIEDDKVDAMTVKRALKDVNIKNSLAVVRNGEEALEYLGSEDKEKPCIIFLDLNMPRMNGIEFLRAARDAGVIQGIPVIVLTTSKEQNDRLESFNLCAAGYMIKPVDYQKFLEIIKTIDSYWTVSELPY
ncbi:response regulator receiver domain-containing protein [Candidatus Omnitrophus magneticus]|uniref:Response regulator receiver domain-containing protein n=1 Tax=Candidatus Omnitrophus magneticus TaxID=1609969 RepID=A0A0F0CKT6_9BACT|nr:response regulator receiver domain-containing protein [Candidatus Omnitrophus magneticus]